VKTKLFYIFYEKLNNLINIFDEKNNYLINKYFEITNTKKANTESEIVLQDRFLEYNDNIDNIISSIENKNANLNEINNLRIL